MMKTVGANKSRHERLKYEIRRRGLSFASLARREGIHHSLLAGVSAGSKRSERAAKILADAIGSTPAKLWPEIYGGDDE